MEKPPKIKSTVEYSFTIENLSNDRVRVQMVTNGATLSDVMVMTEYMMWISAKESDFPFEEVLRMLCNGARTYEGIEPLQILPRKGKEK